MFLILVFNLVKKILFLCFNSRYLYNFMKNLKVKYMFIVCKYKLVILF